MGLITKKVPHDFQEDASKEIIKHWNETLEDIKEGGRTARRAKRDSLRLLKAPTGSGKTFIVSLALIETAKSFNLSNDKVVYFVLAPNSLNTQLRKDMQNNGVGADGLLSLKSIADITSGSRVKNNDVVFTNYASVDKEKNTIIAENEKSTDLKTQMDSLRDKGMSVILIVDEAHVNYSGEKAQKFINEVLQPDIQLLVTATPHDGIVNYDSTEEEKTISVTKASVVDSGAIVHSVVFNQGMENLKYNLSNDDSDADLLFIDAAINKKEEMDQAYKDAGSDVNTLLAIQIPSKAKDVFQVSDEYGEIIKDSDQEKNKLNTVLKHLEKRKPEWFVTESDDNKGHVDDKVAIWLANQQTHNIKDDVIKPNNSHVDVIIFKEAIAVGWDCPRIGSKGLLRENKSKPFTKQTIGRAMRQPEQKHYENELLNHAYAYTAYDLIEKIVNEDQDGSVELPKISTCLTYSDKIVKEIVSIFRKSNGLPSYEYALNKNSLIKKATIENAARNYLESLGVSMDKLNEKDYSEKIGIDLDSKNSNINIIIGDADADNLNTLEKVESKISHSNNDNKKEYENILKSALSNNSISDGTGKRLREIVVKHLIPQEILTGRKRLTETEFINKIVATDDNKIVFTNFIQKIMNDAYQEEGVSGKGRLTQRKNTPFNILDEILVKRDSSEHKSESSRVSVSESLYDSIDTKSDSQIETKYVENVPEKIVHYLSSNSDYKALYDRKKLGHRYLKNGSQGGNLGIEYSDSKGKHLTYPDFIHFFLEDDMLYVSIVEVKSKDSKKGDSIDTVRAKAKALKEYSELFSSEKIKIVSDVWAFENNYVKIIAPEEADDTDLISIDKAVKRMIDVRLNKFNND